jgi:hypothetical protein
MSGLAAAHGAPVSCRPSHLHPRIEEHALRDERSSDTPHGRRILVISNETVAGTVLHQAIRFRAKNVGGEVLVVAPALVSRRGRRKSDSNAARRAAEERLKASLERLAAAGISARGEVGDGDPLRAIADALTGFAADEIIIATHPEARSRWLARDVVARARDRFEPPTLHIVVDVSERGEYIAGDNRARVSASAPTLTAS